MYQDLVQKLRDRKVTVGIVGLGYVGLPLARAFAQAGHRVLGFDVDPAKVDKIERGESYIDAVPTPVLAQLRRDDLVRATTDFRRVAEVRAVAICVPTPLTVNQDPDTSYIEKTGEAIAPHLQPGTLVVLESTTYPGTTDELLRPRLEKAGLTAGKDLFLAFSPERENPGDATWSTSRIPKVVGADDDGSRAAAIALYEGAVAKVVPVSSSRVAEATKLLENIYRCVNIALVNELKQCFSRMGIDIFEVIEAAKTKPFGFQAFYPGPGLGGHCLAGAETVWVRDAEGVHALPFRALFDRVAATHGVERRPDGVELTRPRDLEALSFDLEAREPTFAPITELFRRRSPQPLLRLGVAGNRSLTVTGGHPMLTHTGFQITETRADELSVGDSLVLLTAWPDEVTSCPTLLGQAVGGAQALTSEVAHAEPEVVGAHGIRQHAGTERRHAPLVDSFVGAEVTSIEEVAPEEVFSMEVAGTHTFVTSYGLAVHNCIPLDPVYLSWKAKEFGVRTRFIDLAGEVNTAMPEWVVERTMDALNEHGKALKGSRVLLLGMAYKKNVDDVRESPALVLWDMLRRKGAQLEYHDPHIAYVGSGRHYAIEQASQPLDAATLGRADVVLIVTDHDAVDYGLVVEHAKLVVDTRNATRDLRAGAKHVFQA